MARCTFARSVARASDNDSPGNLNAAVHCCGNAATSIRDARPLFPGRMGGLSITISLGDAHLTRASHVNDFATLQPFAIVRAARPSAFRSARCRVLFSYRYIMLRTRAAAISIDEDNVGGLCRLKKKSCARERVV